MGKSAIWRECVLCVCVFCVGFASDVVFFVYGIMEVSHDLFFWVVRVGIPKKSGLFRRKTDQLNGNSKMEAVIFKL